MTDRVNALTVVLEKDVRIDDIQPLIAAIEQLKGVLTVDTNVADVSNMVAEMRVRGEVIKRLVEVVQTFRKGA